MKQLLEGGEDDTRGVLERHSWNVTEHDTAALARHYQRDLADPFTDSTDAQAPEPPWLPSPWHPLAASA